MVFAIFEYVRWSLLVGLNGGAPQPGGGKPREAGFSSEVVQAGVRRVEVE